MTALSWAGGVGGEITTDPISWVNEHRTVSCPPQPGTVSRQPVHSHTPRQSNSEETRLRALNSAGEGQARGAMRL